MKFLLTLVVCLINLSAAQAAEDSNPLPVTTEIGTPHTQLPPEVERYNELIETLSKLTERLEALEIKVMVLENPKSLDGARTQAEADATKKAAENAPSLVDSPAIAQYNQANGLLKQGELDKAKEAFLYITREYPEDIYAYKSWLHVGDIQLKMKNFGEADKAFSEALTGKLETPLMIDARLGLAEAKTQREDLKAACEQLAIIQKEQLSPEQKQRLEAISKRASCSPAVKPEEKK